MKYLAIANEDAAQAMVTAVFNVVHEMQEFRSYYSSGFYYPWTQHDEHRQLIDGLLFSVVVYGPRYDFHHIRFISMHMASKRFLWNTEHLPQGPVDDDFFLWTAHVLTCPWRRYSQDDTRGHCTIPHCDGTGWLSHLEEAQRKVDLWQDVPAQWRSPATSSRTAHRIC